MDGWMIIIYSSCNDCWPFPREIFESDLLAQYFPMSIKLWAEQKCSAISIGPFPQSEPTRRELQLHTERSPIYIFLQFLWMMTELYETGHWSPTVMFLQFSRIFIVESMFEQLFPICMLQQLPEIKMSELSIPHFSPIIICALSFIFIFCESSPMLIIYEFNIYISWQFFPMKMSDPFIFIFCAPSEMRIPVPSTYTLLTFFWITSSRDHLTFYGIYGISFGIEIGYYFF